VGYNVSDNLNTESSLIALRLAIKQRKNKEIPLIQHLDRGLQYCANEYQKILHKNDIQPSMTQNPDPYENAVAERINGILKQEFYIDKYNKDLQIMKQIVKETVYIYNEKRLNLSNHMLTLNQMHQQNKLVIKT
jgi:transposase InsO family protein